MESTERLVRTWMATGRTDEINAIKTTLLDVVKALGDYLTSEEDESQTKGVELLSTVLKQCPPDRLNKQGVRVLSTFFCSKLEEFHTVIPALNGLVTLAALPTFTSPDATGVIEAIFAHVKMKSLVQSARFLVFTIIDNLMAKHRDALKAMGKEFLGRYLIIAEGEKDPRNLLVAFAIARVIILEFDISSLVESFFNIAFCYFPITFRPPPNDPYGISTDDLRHALRGCMAASPLFGPLAIPLYLEKLTAGSPAIKRDTLQTMDMTFPVYGAALLRSHARKLWNAIKLEVFQPVDTKTEAEALKTVQALINTLYAGQSTGTDVEVTGLARDVCEECIEILREPEKSQAKPAIKIISAFISTTPSVSQYALSQSVPHLVKLFRNPDEASTRPSILELLSDLIVAAKEAPTDAILLSPYKDDTLALLIAGLKLPSAQHQAVEGLSTAVTTKGLLTDEEMGFIVHNVNELLQINSSESQVYNDEVLDLLSTISHTHPHHVAEQTLPLLFDSLPDQPPQREAATERVRYWRFLQALRKLSLQSELFETLVIRLTTKLDLAWKVATSPSEGDTETAAAYAHAILKTILQTLEAKVKKGHTDVAKYLDRLIPRLFNLLFYSAFLPSTQGHLTGANDHRIVELVARITETIVQTISVEQQTKYTQRLFRAFLGGEYQLLSEGHQKIPEGVTFAPFDQSAPSRHKGLVSLFSATVVPLHAEVPLPVSNLEEFLTIILTWGLTHAVTAPQRHATWHIISSIVNKHVDEVSGFLTRNIDEFWIASVANASMPLGQRQKSLEFWTWTTKALVVRSHPAAPKFVDKLFEVFGDDTINWQAAKALGQIGGSDQVITKQNHTVIRILYAQKYINSILPRVIAGAKNKDEPKEQIAHLVALTSLITAIPKVAYAHELPSLVPLLLQGLELPDPDIRANIIQTFQAAAEGDSPEKSLVSEHASSLVTAMLKNSSITSMPSARVRAAALKYLGTLPSIVRYDVLHPSKAHVVKELGKILDDPKRNVRQEAAIARGNWFQYSG
ncbi:hypothetical protein AX16_001362 [Volvariella volvacea WC 439]|nr:hypothetical protein AX16_001362 [Volvariella volvacea WC 439]